MHELYTVELPRMQLDLEKVSNPQGLGLGLGLGPCSMAKNMAKNAKKAKNMAKKGVGYG